MLVLIPSAGVGSRLDYHTQHYNKFIIMLGYKGEHIKQYLNLVYKNRKFIFKEVKNYNGKGSGLTLTLKKALPLINRPFFFSCK